MATLERLDQIRDTLIGRGIGTSGLTSQAIQRANLPTLSSELATSRGTLRNLQSQQDQAARAAKLASSVRQPKEDIKKIIPRDKKGTVRGTPQFILNPPNPKDPLGKFSITGIGPSGGQTKFSSAAELAKFLKENPQVSSALAVRAGANMPDLTGRGGGLQLQKILATLPSIARKQEQALIPATTLGELGVQIGGSGFSPEEKAEREERAKKATPEDQQQEADRFKNYVNQQIAVGAINSLDQLRQMGFTQV